MRTIALLALLLLPGLLPAETITAADVEAWVQVPDAGEKAMEYYRSGNLLWATWRLQTLLIPLILLVSGFTVWLRDRTSRAAGGRWWLGLGLFVLAYLITDWVLELPLRYYSGFVRQHAYGLSNQSFLKWGRDALLGLGVACVLGCVVLGVVYGLMRWSRSRWWLLAAALTLPWSFFLLFLQPVVVAPLFNEFGPMKNRALEIQILQLAERCGIEGGRVFEVAKSVDTKRVNAYVSGFMGTKRIVLWDTLLEKLDRDEVLFVMGHEMGHYVLGHMVLGLSLASLGAFLLLGLVHLLGTRILEVRGERWGVRELADPASLPLFLILVTLLSWAGEPIGLLASRHMEREADRFGLELTRKNRPAARAFVKLQLTNLSNPWPGPLYKTFRSTHPPVGERVVFCNTYRPWVTGAWMEYARHFERAEPPDPGPARPVSWPRGRTRGASPFDR